MSFYPELDVCSQLGSPRGTPGKSSNFKPVPRTLKNQKKVTPGSPKVIKMTPKTTPGTPIYWKSWKSEIIQNTQYLPWFKHIQPQQSGIISIPGSPKTWTWKLSPILPPKITENHHILPKVGPRRLPKSTPKSLKMDIRTLLCPLGVPLDPRITKMVSLPQKEPQGLQNHRFR